MSQNSSRSHSHHCEDETDAMASVLSDPRQKTDDMASGDNRGQKEVPFGLAPICLGSKTEAKSRK